VARFVGTCPAPRHQIHAYADDGIRDHRGLSRCGICGLPASNRLHKLPERSAEAREHEARKLGEA
jgi:hypothetical protein